MSANSVWSLPMPTLRPGCHLVPRWRARMLPATTDCPPNSLMPRRRPAESRPLREEPPAFLCAIAQLLDPASIPLGAEAGSTLLVLGFAAPGLFRLLRAFGTRFGLVLWGRVQP